MYKSNIGLGGLAIIFLTTFVSFSGKVAEVIPPFIAFSLVLVVGLVIVFRWMYESYRTRILHIAANALLEIKKRKLILATREAHKVIEIGGRNSTDFAVLHGVC